MKVINFGDNTYRIFGDDLKVEGKLPTGTYDVLFSEMSGYSLVKRTDFETTNKVYGPHKKLVNQMLTRYEQFNSNFGVILGGRKGTGKTMTARLLSEAFKAKDIPTIIISKATPGLPDFIQSIEQEAFILFDEFEKVFPKGNHDTKDLQSQFLPVFDGLSNTKHFYMITINDYNKLNDYFLGRTGRFYYNITFDAIGKDEITEILNDKLDESLKLDINRLAFILSIIDVNYDQLMSIIKELNLGSSIDYIFKYLNLDLSKTLGNLTYDIKIFFENGDIAEEQNLFVDIMNPYFGKSILAYAKATYDEDPNIITHRYYGDLTFDTNILEITDNHKLVANNFICGDGQPAIEFEPDTSYSDDKTMRTLTRDDNIKVKRVELTRRMAKQSQIAIDTALKNQ